MAKSSKRSRKKTKGMKTVYVGLVVLFVAIIAASFFFYGGGLSLGNSGTDAPQGDDVAPDDAYYEVSEITGEQFSVNIESSGFNPDELTISAGDRVLWTNMDSSEHSIVSDSGEFGFPSLAPGWSYEYAFAEQGTYGYHSGTNSGMTGTIVVE